MPRQAMALAALLGALVASAAVARAEEPACEDLFSASPCAPAESCAGLEALLDQLAADLPPGDCAIPDLVPGVACEEPARSPWLVSVLGLSCDGRTATPQGPAARH